MIRECEFSIDANSWKKTAPPTEFTSRVGRVRIDVTRALLATALRTRLPNAFGLQLADFWAWLRYFPAVAVGLPELRLRAEWDDLDAHQKTILSDDWGMGFATDVIGEWLDVAIWGNTLHVARLLGRDVMSLSRTEKRGPSKSPDFVGLRTDWRFVVLECKGTQSGRGKLKTQFEQGVRQKRKLNFVSPSALAESLVAGLSIPAEGSREFPLLRVSDPEPSGDGEDGPVSPDDIATAVCQSELAAALPMMGLVATGTFLERTPLDSESGLTSECIAELEDLLRQQHGPFIGNALTFRLRPGTMTTQGGEARSVRTSITIERGVLETLMNASSVREGCFHLARRAVARLDDGRTKVSGVGSPRSEASPGEATPERSNVITASGVRVAVDWSR